MNAILRRAAILAATLLPLLGAQAAAPEFNPARTAPSALSSPDAGRIIVKFRDGSAQGGARSKAIAEKVSRVGSRTGIPLKASRGIGAGMELLEIEAPVTPLTLEEHLALLRSDPDVEFAEPDYIRFPLATPNDPLFPGQWYLQNAATTPSAVNAMAAWDRVTGSTGVVIAVLDTGVRYEHPDLLRAQAGGRLLPGYDFVSQLVRANDGDARDGDASDPGDWITVQEANQGLLSNCPPSDSSWHGTRVSGIIGALTGNSAGVAGLGWSGWILPVRTLGKCGAPDSDILAAMLWAGGLAVDGAPANPYPARIVNMSLGSSSGACPSTYRNAVADLAARRVLVVAAVGNDGGPVDTPANCPGVAGIAGIRHAGTKVGFSNLGPGVALSAPGGNCVNVGQGEPCLYSIDTTTNLGAEGPGANGYTDQINFNVGTSFAAPIVSGIAGLMVAVNGRLSPAQLVARLQEGAKRPFPVPSDPSIPTCRVPAGPTDVQTAECVCTLQTCGAGMANAAGAVEAALRPVAAVTLPAGVAPGQNVVLRGAGSGAACNRTLSRYQWTIVDGGATPPGIVGADSDTATVVAPAAGAYSVRLTVTDDTGRQDVADVVVSPTAATSSAPSVAGGPACPTPVSVTPPVSVSVSPSSVTVVAGTGSQAFVATVANSPDTRVNWFVNDIAGGTPTVGTITADGLYRAPASRPDPSTVTVKAVSVADPSRSGTATVAINLPPPIGGGTGGGGGGGGGALDLLAALVLSLGVLARALRRD